MSLTTDTALDSLADSAKPIADPRHTRRMAYVRELLADDLTWVEEVLAAVVEEGEAPATLAASHLVNNGGKRVRPTAALLSAACFGEIPQAVRELAVVVELVHNATLLHDDVIDEGMDRRGAPTSRLMWGNAVSVLAGDVLLVHSLRRTQEAAPEMMRELLEMLFQLVSGEVVQLRGRTDLDVSEATYNQVLSQKTASLFRFATTAAARLAGARVVQQQALGSFGEHVGMAFQLVDDVLDYSSESTGKTLCADLREGKLTLPLVLALEGDAALLELVRQVHQGDDDLVEDIRRAVLASGTCERVIARAHQQTSLALDSLSCIPSGPAKALLAAIAQQLVNRAG